jgi:PBSX family phage terminase large subunit
VDEQRNVSLLPKQWEFLQSNAPELLYSGAAAGGKTRILCQKLVHHAAQRPGAMFGLFRKHNVTISQTTLHTLLEGDGILPPVLPAGYYTHNISKQYIDIRNGGRIIYSGLDAPKGQPPLKIGSLNLAGVYIDEGIELTEKDYEMLETRVRSADPANPDVPGQICIATNPGSPEHWIYKKFFPNGVANTDPYCKVIQCRSTENTFLPDWYIQRLERMTGQMHKRYVLGEWIGFEGQVFGDDWEPEIHILRPDGLGNLVNDRGTYKRPIDAFSRVERVGVDDGYTDPMVFEEMRADNDGRLLISKEWYKEHQTQANAARFAASFSPGAHFVVDSAAPNLIKSMRDEGLHASPVKKGAGSIMDGVNLVMARMQLAGDGLPRLFIHENCVNFIRELGLYIWNTGKDEPVDQYNHAIDAVRYGIMDIDGREQGVAHF